MNTHIAVLDKISAAAPWSYDFSCIADSPASAHHFSSEEEMSNDRSSPLNLLMTCPHVRKQMAMAHGALLLAFGIHTWIESAFVEGASTQSAFLGGALSTLVFLIASAVVGWVCGGLALESGENEVSAEENLRDFWRKLTLAGVAVTIGIALGA